VFAAKNKVEVRDVKIPDPGPDEIGVRTLYSGISIGTELWILKQRYWDAEFPCVSGYQKVGVVETAGPEVTNYRQGDTVFLRTTKLSGKIRSSWGGHTGYSVMPAADPYMFKLPEGLDCALGSLLVMPAVGYHGAAEVMGIGKGEWVAVIGVGMIGQFSAQTAHLLGGNVIAIDLSDERLALAGRYAGAIEINPSQTDVKSEIERHCPDGLDVVIDTTSNEEIINQSFHWLRQKGKYCFQGYYPDKTALDLLQPHIKELVFYNPTDSSPEGAYACGQHLATGKMEMQAMVSCHTSLTDAPRVYDRLVQDSNSEMGIFIEWQNHE
jgi:propanol-preferring alcohol dehydrogenase